MKKVTLRQVQESIADIANRDKYTEDILYELLAAYGRSPNAITQLRQGQTNRAEAEGEVLQKDVVYFKTVPVGTSLEHTVEDQFENPLTQRFNPRYLIATDLTNFAAKDTLKNTTLSIKWADIDNDLDFFYGWTGDEVVDSKTEAVADRRAADKMNLLYAEIEKLNREKLADPESNFRHELNVFFTRLLFCFFAEDTGLFNDKQFTLAVKLTQQDGSDLHDFFEQLFIALDCEDHSSMPAPYSGFPHVNGSLFNTSKHSIAIPDFNAQARHLILECTSLNWGEINPDIFGTMFQGVVDPDHRDENGMDYTSVPNIMKVIEPLFLDNLRERFDAVYNTPGSLRELLDRIRNIKVFDPACGSGNFLIISYKRLRELEGSILARLEELKREQRKKPGLEHTSLFSTEDLSGMQKDTADTPLASGIDLENFYGIELDDFAHELAILSLYLAKHQMDSEFEKQFPVKLKHLPLIENKNVVKANATKIDWDNVLHNNGTDEIYIIGNPPYKGSRKQSDEQKKDMLAVAGDLVNYKSLDYISIWFLLGSKYIANTKAQLCFVSTNSITQGEQVGILWPEILGDLEIGFAYASFKWQNSARDNAGVTVIMISLRNRSAAAKYLFSDGVRHEVKNISAYLSVGSNTIVRRSSKAISKFMPKIDYGSFALDGGFLTLSEDDRNALITQDNRTEKYIKEFSGSQELIQGKKKYCIWIDDSDVKDAEDIPVVKARLDAVQEWRSSRSGKDSQKNAATPWKFAWRNYKKSGAILFPIISSERRPYIPIGYMNEDVIISNAALAIYDAEPWLFALLESNMHMTWVRAVCGQLETRVRYSSSLGYNTFPVNLLSEDEKGALNKSARQILLARAAHPEKTLADMYDPDKMPANLREAHDENDRLVDSLYKKGGFRSDEDRLATLFDLYEQLTARS